MDGLLSDHPLAEIIHELSGGRLSGVLRVSRERAKGAVYFDEGRVVGALTNLRAYRLTESLRRNAAVGAAKLDALVRPEMTDDAAGAALVAAGLLSPEELRRLRERLASEVLRQLLQWEDGEWSFDARVRLDEGQHVRVEVGQLLVESARRLSHAFAAKSFRDAGERLSLADATAMTGGDANGGPQLQPSEGFVLSRFDAPLSLGELVAVSGLPDEETRKAVYVLVLGGLLSRERPPRALPAAAAAAATAPRKTPPAAERPNAPPAATTKPAEEAKQPAAETATTEAAVAPKDPKDELAELFERAEAGSHYEVLGVGQLSKPDEIKRAYYALARRFHPDRFRQTVPEDERQRVELAFAKIAQAYDLLKDSAQRAAYDLKLSASRAQAPTADAAPPERKTEAAQPRESDHAPRPDATADAPPGKANADPLRRAEELFQAGQAALGQQNYAAATKCLGEAVLLVPQQARYRAYFGRLLARDKATRRQAEAELQAAISLDARNVSYRLMLAELYRDVGLRRRAEAELEQALSIDRTSDAAR
ncbi:MAG TPA: DUF4388 domain-containing protein, partial [Pyrinomonadaceae bacterium]|nr:DUF4388 domain-containing protein [Pyrinomonadaceae bacterium]